MKRLYWGTSLLSLLWTMNVQAAEVYVREIEVNGLNRVENETVMAYLDIPAGKTVSEEKLNESLKQLYATGLFEDVAFNVTPD